MRQLRPRCLTSGSCELRLQSCVWGAAWLRGVEATAAAAYNLTLYELMKRAGGAVFDVCRRSYPNTRHWLILCGAGNNGGDGYVVARLAAANAGLRVTVVTAASKSKHALPAEASAALAALKEYMEEEKVKEVKEEKEIVQKVCGQVTIQDAHAWQSETIADDIDLIVDGLLGTGISGAPRAEFATLIDRINAISVPRVAIDIPSGLNAETGAVEGACVRADHTVTFIALKPGLLTGRARDYVGKLHYNTLELNDWMLAAERQKEIYCRRLFHTHLQTLLLPHTRSPCSHKGANGKVLLIGGDHGFGGAILMAAEAALRTGAGLVRVLTRAEHTIPLLCRCPEVMVSELNEISLQEGLQWASCIAVGPGLGQGEWGKEIIKQVQRYSEAAIGEEKLSVWDADALNILASYKQQRNTKEEKEEEVKCIKPLKTRILTPHPGEAARLLGCSIADVERDRFYAAKEIANIYGGVVLLKGPGTVLYAAEDVETQVVGLSSSNELLLPHCVIADVGNSGMATGGMGDVLTGIIAGLLGQRMSLWSAACTGCLVHGTAADLAVAAQGGERGLTATMLFNHIHSCVNPHEM